MHDIEVVGTEMTMFHPLVCGHVRPRRPYIDGHPHHLADFKTSKAIYDEAALQLCRPVGLLHGR
jgi:hypothetical protein